MDIVSYLTHPFLWGGLGLVVIVIIVLSIWISKRRAREVEELEKMFPEHTGTGEGLDISVEKVRRATLERERRKKTQPYLPKNKTYSQEAEKALPNEDRELNLKKEENDQPPQREERVMKKEKKSLLESFIAKKPSSVDANEMEEHDAQPVEREDGENSIAVRKTTRRARNENKAEPDPELKQEKKKEEENTDAATSRHLYKRSLLNPDRLMNQDSQESDAPSPEPSFSPSPEPSLSKQENEKKALSTAGEGIIGKNDQSGTTDTKKNFLFSTSKIKAAEHPDQLQTDAEEEKELPSRSKRWTKKRLFKR